MRVLIPIDTNPNNIGGGWTFLRNFTKGVQSLGHKVVNEGEADICLIPGATMVQRDTFNKIKEEMPVVLRVDGIPEDWRNRGTGTTRLKEYAKESNLVIYQSEFARETVGRLLGQDGVTIYNGVDFSIFNPTGNKATLPKGNPRVLAVMYRQDPNKRPEEVIQTFREYSLVNKDALLVLVGRWPKDWAQYNFGFFNNEKFIHIPSAREQSLAAIMRTCDVMWYPSYADPCPNIVSESLACGLKVDFINPYGGTQEILDRGIPDTGKQMAEQYMNIFKMVIDEGGQIET